MRSPRPSTARRTRAAVDSPASSGLYPPGLNRVAIVPIAQMPRDVFIALLLGSGATMSQRPNILLVMTDQLVPFLTGAYGPPVVKTPALDALAARGVRFDAAYTPYPLCAPARAAFMTGRHASSLGVY